MVATWRQGSTAASVRARISLIARASDWYVGRETCLAWSVDSHKAAMCLDEVGPRAARTSERRSVHVSSRKALSFRSHQLVRMTAAGRADRLSRGADGGLGLSNLVSRAAGRAGN